MENGFETIICFETGLFTLAPGEGGSEGRSSVTKWQVRLGNHD